MVYSVPLWYLLACYHGISLMTKILWNHSETLETAGRRWCLTPLACICQCFQLFHVIKLPFFSFYYFLVHLLMCWSLVFFFFTQRMLVYVKLMKLTHTVLLRWWAAHILCLTLKSMDFRRCCHALQFLESLWEAFFGLIHKMCCV